MAFDPWSHGANPWMLVRVGVEGAVLPMAVPWFTVDDDGVRRPQEPGAGPAPRGKCGADRDARAEGNRAADRQTVRGPREDHQWVIVGNVIHIWVHRQDLNIAVVRDYVHITIRLQITVLVGFPAHPLHC